MSERETVETWRTAELIPYILKDLEKRVKKDQATKLSVLSTGLSAYLPEPINLFLKGESGIGKTYNVVETLRYFPPEDIWFLGGLSPKALIHDYGKLLNKDGDPLDLSEKPVKPSRKSKIYKNDMGEFKEAEYQEALERYKERYKAYIEEIRNSYTLIDLSHKILVFLEAPEFNTFKTLFPILSHDTERIEYKFTSKEKLITKRVVIQGFPATIFLSTDKKYIEELATRSFTATPEASTEKIKEANILSNLKASLPWQYNHGTLETQVIQQLIVSVRKQLVDENADVVIPFMNLHELFPKEIIRDMRDFQHFTQFLKTVTVLNFYQRAFMKVKDKKFLLSTIGDVKEALKVYQEVFETTRTGTEQRILTFYHDSVKTKGRWYLKELTAEYNSSHKKKLSSETIRKRLERLDEIGYVNTLKDDVDKRLNVYESLVKTEEMSTISHNLEMWTLSKAELEKGFETWLKTIRQPLSFYTHKKFSENSWGVHEIKEAEEIFSLVFSEGGCRIVSKEDLTFKTEKKPEIIGFSKKRIIVDNSEKPDESWILKREGNKVTAKNGNTMFVCPLCAAYGKQLLFNSQEDLDLHIKGVHTGYPSSSKNS